MSWKVGFAAAALALLPVGAKAEWYKASSRHFVIYSEQKPEKLRAYAEKLERFDQAVRKMRRWDDPKLGDGNRLTIYAVKDVAAVQELYGKKGFVYGFFQSSYAGPIAFTPRGADNDEWGLSADSVFFHEYGHHLMFQQFAIPMPKWFVEGFAELVASPIFKPDGTIMIGQAPKHRAFGLYSGGGISTREMLVPDPKEKLDPQEMDTLYGRGFVLTHYLLFDQTRKGQLGTYFQTLIDGGTLADAANKAFGDLRALDREIEKYMRNRKIAVASYAASELAIGSIDVTPLGAGAQEAIAWQMMSKRGVDQEKAKKVIDGLRPIGARYPTDPFVQGALAEAEFDVERYDLSLAAAEAALKSNPKDAQALIYKGRAMMELADKGDKAASYAEARKAFLAANTLDVEDPEPLYLYYLSFVRGGRAPTANAVAALHYAAALAPADTMVRMNSAVQRLRDKQYAEAREAFVPVAFDPHGGELSEQVRGALAQIDAGKPELAMGVLTSTKEEADAGEKASDDPKKEKEKPKTKN